MILKFFRTVKMNVNRIVFELLFNNRFFPLIKCSKRSVGPVKRFWVAQICKVAFWIAGIWKVLTPRNFWVTLLQHMIEALSCYMMVRMSLPLTLCIIVSEYNTVGVQVLYNTMNLNRTVGIEGLLNTLHCLVPDIIKIISAFLILITWNHVLFC